VLCGSERSGVPHARRGTGSDGSRRPKRREPNTGDPMSKGRFVSIVGLVVLTVSVCLPLSTAHADVRDLGEICMLLFIDGRFGPPVPKNLAVLAYGDRRQHILLTNTDAPEHGSAVLRGDKVLVTLNTSSASADLSTAVSTTTHMILNASTLNGRFTEMITWPASAPQDSRITGDVVSCN